MKKALPVINLLLGIAGVLLLGLTVVLWTQPKYSSRVDGASIAPPPKDYQEPDRLRDDYPSNITGQIIEKNLFRKDRKDYVPPPPPPPNVQEPPKPMLPPPELKVSGVILMKSKKIAVLEGTYSIEKGGRSFEKKKLKKKGYKMGDQIGTYKITDINNKDVVLDNEQGSLVRVSLDKRDPKKKIKRKGNLLYHKGKRVVHKNVAPKRRGRPGADPSNAGTQSPVPPPVIICGANTKEGRERLNNSPGMKLFQQISGAKTRK